MSRPMDVLVIGGTRFVGPRLVRALLDRDHRVTTFNRGKTPTDLPDSVERLHGDRSDPAQLARGIGGREFDACVDTIAMRGGDTLGAVEVLDGRVGHYVHFSTGQVYLVRAGCPVPAREEDYDGPIVEAPPEEWARREWRYGIEKRECEDALEDAWVSRRFPATRLRLPMIHGAGDPKGRIQGYVLRLTDGGPLLVPLESGPRIRHVHVDDVVDAVVRIVEDGRGIGAAYNLAPGDLVSFHDFLARLGEILDATPDVVRLPRDELLDEGLFPACSPLSNPWMSVLDGTRAREELGVAPRALAEWLAGLVERLENEEPEAPDGYRDQRERERALA
ncbi:MAG: NAD-dependent epimerase/dehydratase family protein [Gemmatimonadetes bacterium]|nr:NAD-dependent epimerase/dehydratase family protein [Gemmatimonadota bacterium]